MNNTVLVEGKVPAKSGSLGSLERNLAVNNKPGSMVEKARGVSGRVRQGVKLLAVLGSMTDDKGFGFHKVSLLEACYFAAAAVGRPSSTSPSFAILLYGFETKPA